MKIFAESVDCSLGSTVLYLYFAIVFLSGCGLFSTREPESPVAGGQSFTPPTMPSLVIENLKNAVKEKNAENFTLCLADTARGDYHFYRFEPAAEVAARYATLFSSWGVTAERQAFISLMSKIPADVPPSLAISGGYFDVITQDSAVYIGDYLLVVNHSATAIPKRGTGVMRLTIAPNSGGQWSIIRWSDANSAVADKAATTWSTFKARFSN